MLYGGSLTGIWYTNFLDAVPNQTVRAETLSQRNFSYSTASYVPTLALRHCVHVI